MEYIRVYLTSFTMLLMLLFIIASPLSYADELSVSQTNDIANPSGNIDNSSPVVTKDPLEKFNRLMFTFNDKLDYFILKPIATLYNKVMPHPLNRGIHNAFMNLNNLPTTANDLLQFHFQQAANDLWRLGINTTVGIGGLFDIAKLLGLQPYSNDFGLTLAYYGYDDSTYVVLPFLGPHTIRDAIGVPVDYYLFSIYPAIYPASTRYAIYGLSVIDSRAQLLKFQSVLDEAAVDKYAFQRNAYLQRRAYKIKQNEHLDEQLADNDNITIPQNNPSMPGMNIGT